MGVDPTRCTHASAMKRVNTCTNTQKKFYRRIDTLLRKTISDFRFKVAKVYAHREKTADKDKGKDDDKAKKVKDKDKDDDKAKKVKDKGKDEDKAKKVKDKGKDEDKA